MQNSLWRYITTAFRGYYGLKRLLIAVTLGWSAALIVLVYFNHKFIWITGLYVVVYWTRNLRSIAELLTLAGSLYVILKTDIVKRQASRLLGFCEHLEPDIYRRPPTWKASAAMFASLVICIPYIDLYTIGAEHLLFKYLSPGVILIRALSNVLAGRSRGYILALALLRYPRRNFNCAALGPKSSDVDVAVGRIKYHAKDSRDFADSAYPRTDWKGRCQMATDLKTYLGITSTEEFTFHESTTGAIHAAVEECVMSRFPQPLRIVYTDAECPRLVEDSLREFEEQGRARLTRANIMSLILEQRPAGKVADTIAAACEAVQADVLIVSHVVYSLGYVVDIKAVRQRLSQIEKQPIIVVDGAQAMGNVAELQPVIDLADYYAGCTQKWLCTNHNLGMLLRNRTLLDARSLQLRPRKTFGGGAIQPYYELAVLLSREFNERTRSLEITKHNADLANLFRSEIRQYGFKCFDVRIPNGIVAIEAERDSANLLKQRLDALGFVCESILIVTRQQSLTILRFSFHFYHESYDVDELINVLGQWRSEGASNGDREYVSGARGGGVFESNPRAGSAPSEVFTGDRVEP